MDWEKIIDEIDQIQDCFVGQSMLNGDVTCCTKLYIIDQDISEKILDKTKGNYVGIYVLFLCGISILQQKYNADNNRYLLGCQPLVLRTGMARVLPFTGMISADMTLEEMLKHIYKSYSDMNKNENTSINYIRKIFEEKLGQRKTYLHSSVIMSDRSGDDEARFYGEDLIWSLSKNDYLTITIKVYGNQIKEYLLDRLWRHLKCVLAAILDFPNKKVGEVSLLSEEEQYIVLNQFNKPVFEEEQTVTFSEIWKSTVHSYGDKTAVIDQFRQLSYRELETASNKMAKYLVSNGVKKNSIVGVLIDRGCEMLIGILGIIKAGGAYLPILPTYPEARIKYIIDDSQISLVLTVEPYVSKIPSDIKSEDIPKICSANAEDIDINFMDTPNDLLYVIYTSGSTGKPKGVMIHQAAFINRVRWMIRQYGLGSKDIILQKTSFCFDVSVYELLAMSFIGGTVCMLAPGDEMNPQSILRYICINKITLIHFVPSMFHAFLLWMENSQRDWGELHTLRYIFCSGEVLTAGDVNKFYDKVSDEWWCQLVNLYGPTETAIDVTHFECNRYDRYSTIPIGKPIDHAFLMVMDEKRQLLPIGITGELYISGICLASGYINNETLTSECFVQNTYGNGRMYKTGDLVRWMDDGNLEYISRMDSQAKIRGYRIEPGEVESVLLASGMVEAAVVFTKNIGGSICLCACFISNNYSKMNINNYLLEKLPSYMIPSYYMRISQIPVTSNGKADNKKICEDFYPDQNDEGYVEPTNETEILLSKLFCDILEIEKVGITESFFELGGYSIKAFELMMSIYDEFNVSVTVKEIYEYKSVRELSKLILYRNKADLCMDFQYKVFPGGIYNTTPNQRAFYFNGFIKNPITNISAFYIKLDKPIDEEIIISNFRILAKRHETLRTYFYIKDKLLIQELYEDPNYVINYYDFRKSSVNKIYKKLRAPFDLKNDPLIRFYYGKGKRNKYILLVEYYDIVCDGLSWNILLYEFLKLYKGINLDFINYSYMEYCQERSNQILNSTYIDSRNYWVEKYLNLNEKFFIKPKRGKARLIGFSIRDAIFRNIKCYAERNNASIYIILYSLISLVMMRYYNENDIVIGCPVSGRISKKEQNVVGLLSNICPIKASLQWSQTYHDYFIYIKERIFNDFEHQEVAFYDILNSLQAVYQKSVDRLFDIMLSLSVQKENEMVKNNLQLKQIVLDDKANNLIHFSFCIRNNSIFLDIKFDSGELTFIKIYHIYRELIRIADIVLRDEYVILSEL